MLIRVRGGDAGIKEYLENGQKDGRDYSRDELDERVILSGDLELTDAVIKNMDKTGERYLHITLAFKEDEISREKLQEITDEFKQFAMTAYEGDEYNFYAEAHLPKLKTYTNQKTGELVERIAQYESYPVGRLLVCIAHGGADLEEALRQLEHLLAA